MVFSDLFFIFVFIPLFTLCYLLAYQADRHFNAIGTDSCRSRNLILVIFSLIFYAWGEPVYVFLMMGSVVINFEAGKIIDRQERYRRPALVIGLACNIIILAIFKYAGFLADNLRAIGLPVNNPHISLPIGISFYTFQSISYLVDVYRREAPAQRHYMNLLLYISMFPQLIAGPIVRYDLVAQEITHRHVSASDMVEGSFRFLIGLGKKVILANQLSEISDQFLAGGLDSLSTAGAWIGIIAYTFQIFFDFSGYSDMAIGLGRCLGFHFAENFKHPYCCTSITDFWRKWHISLGSFFRDYVYIPMGGNRRHQAVNILVVWFLTGMWHGASWNFIIWGVYFGCIVTLEKYTILKMHIPSFLLHIYSLLLIIIGWGIFYFTDFHQMLKFFTIFFGGSHNLYDFSVQAILLNLFWLWIVCIVLSMPIYDFAKRLFRSLQMSPSGRQSVALSVKFVLSVLLLVVCVSLLVGATNNAFIYTRF